MTLAGHELVSAVPPNTALQRTSPALPVPPLSFKTFGVGSS